MSAVCRIMTQNASFYWKPANNKKNKQKQTKKQTQINNPEKQTKNKKIQTKNEKNNTSKQIPQKKTINTYKGNRKLSSNLCFPRSIPG